jgi:cytochrome c-type biogenesis protein
MTPLFIVSAFVAGLVTFLAPCTLPLVPAYLGYIAGVVEHDIVGSTSTLEARRKILITGLLFVLGFSAVFVVFGLLAGLAGSWVSHVREVFTRVSGVCVIIFGLLMVGVLNPQWLIRERRVSVRGHVVAGSPYMAPILGAAVAFGWTPCIGPILGSVLLLASSTATALQGALLLAVFSLGLGIPFVLLAALFSRTSAWIRRNESLLHTISRIGGVILVLVGVQLLFGSASFFEGWIYHMLDQLGYQDALMRFL